MGDPVTASDADEDTLAYTLGGADAASFAIDNMGQITVGEGTMLDFESETTSYSVTVTATDDEDASDSITVTIMVTDVDETPMFEREAAEFSVEENVPVGTVVGTETAIGVESYSDDSDYFNVDGMGNITTAMMLDYESGTTSYMVTVTATGTDGSTDTIAVTVTVVDMHPGLPGHGQQPDERLRGSAGREGRSGRRPELGYRHRHGRLGRRVDERWPCIGYLAEGRRPGRLGIRCAGQAERADGAEPAQQHAERPDTGPERRVHARRAVPGE